MNKIRCGNGVVESGRTTDIFRRSTVAVASFWSSFFACHQGRGGSCWSLICQIEGCNSAGHGTLTPRKALGQKLEQINAYDTHETCELLARTLVHLGIKSGTWSNSDIGARIKSILSLSLLVFCFRTTFIHVSEAAFRTNDLDISLIVPLDGITQPFVCLGSRHGTHSSTSNTLVLPQLLAWQCVKRNCKIQALRFGWLCVIKELESLWPG